MGSLQVALGVSLVLVAGLTACGGDEALPPAPAARPQAVETSTPSEATVEATVAGSPPTEHHLALAQEVGEWDAKVTIFLAPDADPFSFPGKESCVMVGGYWLSTQFESNFMGAPFEGRGFVGWDPIKARFVGSWVDAANPRLVVQEGGPSEGGRTMEFLGEDPRGARMTTFRDVHRSTGPNQRRMEQWVVGADGEPWLYMTIDYTRRK